MTPKHVAVIGGGIVGVSTAIWLLRAGQSVTLIDRGDPEGRASFGNAGVLASASVIPVTMPGMLQKLPKMVLDSSEPLFLKWSYLPKIAPWALRYLAQCSPDKARRTAAALQPILSDSLEDHRALSAGTHAAARVHETDFVFLYKDRKAYEKDGFGWSLRRDLGYSWDEMPDADRQNYDPIFNLELGFGIRLPNHGRIDDPNAYITDLTAHFVSSGGRLILGEVEDLIREGGKATGVRVKGQTIAADAIAITAGAWSPLLTRKLGLRIPLEAESGFHLEFWGATKMPRAPTMIAGGKFIATPMEGRLRVAGFVGFGGLDYEPTKAPFDLLRKKALAAIPGLSWKTETQWVGHRPATTDSVPLIGAVPGVSGAYLACGHQHVGLTGGPKTGRLLAQIITGTTPNIDMTPYAPNRFL